MRRLLVVLAAMTLAAGFAGPAAASSRPIEYLALGDSLAFGYSPYVSPFDTAGFVGYPEIAADGFRDAVTNASCPGETSSHSISLAGADHGCGAWRFGYGAPLRVAYSTSQLEFADAFLQAHPKTQLVTLDIGANDVGALRDACMATADPIGCFGLGMPAMLATLSANLDTIYDHIRTVDGYNHKLVALTVYSPDYSDALTTWAVSQVNQVLADRTLVWKGTVADGIGAFAAASASYGGDTCAAGLRIPLIGSTGCDDHPSPAGRDLLAETILHTVRAD
jgi:lysophospholipase L1-like esterase